MWADGVDVAAGGGVGEGEGEGEGGGEAETLTGLFNVARLQNSRK